MKTLGQLSPTAVPLAVALSLVLMAGGTYAAGPGGGGANGTAAGTSAAGVSGASSVGAGRGGVSAAPARSGTHAGVSFSNNNAGALHGTAGRGVGAPSGLSLPYHNVQNTGVSTRSAAAPAVSRPANAWSGLAVSSTNNAAASRNSARPTAHANNWTAANGLTGQRLDPGAPGANLPVYNQGNLGNRFGNNRFSGRYYYYPYPYGPSYAPYINYFGGSYGGAYPYYNDIPAADTQFSSGATTVSPQYIEETPANANNQPQPDASTPSPAPPRQGQPDVNAGTIPSNGPDSLVEAVQEELVRRGYYGGKVDAMYNADTKEALRKFQTDHHLAATGLINEATMHALQLD